MKKGTRRCRIRRMVKKKEKKERKRKKKKSTSKTTMDLWFVPWVMKKRVCVNTQTGLRSRIGLGVIIALLGTTLGVPA